MLYIVGTPIGNLSEMSLRGIEVLKNVDVIACEDTRTSGILLSHYNINKPLISYHKFNEKTSLNKIINLLKQEKNVALISDAGMPVISDPGNILINELIKNALPYTVVSGPSALINAFILSGFSYPFTFIGFLPEKKTDAKKLLNSFKNTPSALIFYLAPHDIKNTFDALFEALGDRKVCVVRELTKKFEEVNFTTLSKGYDGITKGEFVLIVDKGEEVNDLNALTVEDHFEFYLNRGLSKNDAIKNVAHDRHVKKDVIYKQINNEKNC